MRGNVTGRRTRNEEVASSTPIVRLFYFHVTTLGKLFTHVCVGHLTPIIWYCTRALVRNCRYGGKYRQRSAMFVICGPTARKPGSTPVS